MQSLSPAYIKTPARAILPQNGAQEGKQVTTKDFREKTAALDGLLGVGQCFDMTARDLTIGGRAARLWVVNGYAQDDLLEDVYKRQAAGSGVSGILFSSYIFRVPLGARRAPSAW